jgi:hypothetical protein
MAVLAWLHPRAEVAEDRHDNEGIKTRGRRTKEMMDKKVLTCRGLLYFIITFQDIPDLKWCVKMPGKHPQQSKRSKP